MKLQSSTFLGRGWGFPPTFSRASFSVQMVEEGEDIRQSLLILFSTALGERIMVPEYGCELFELLFQALTTSLSTQMKVMVERAIVTWEPRIDVQSVVVAADGATPGLATITVEYVVRATNSRSNFVYPFYTNEANVPVPGP